MAKKANRAARRHAKQYMERVRSVLKIPRPQVLPPMLMAAKIMQRNDPEWEEDWAQVQVLDASIAHLEKCRLIPGAVSYMAQEFLKTLVPMREAILKKHRNEPTMPRDWYSASCRQPGDRDYPEPNTFGLGSYNAFSRS